MSQKSTFNQEDADTICAALSEGHSLLSICEAMGLAYSTAVQWEKDNPEHAKNSTRAREIGCHNLADQCIAIADDGRNDWIETTDGTGATLYKLNGEHIQRSKLRIETRMRLIGKWLPKVYGERTTVAGDPDAPLETKATLDASGLSTEVLAALMAAKDAQGKV